MNDMKQLVKTLKMSYKQKTETCQDVNYLAGVEGELDEPSQEK